MFNNSLENQQRLNTIANLAQFVDLFLLLKDSSNNDVIQALNEQNKKYLEKIIEQNETIIKLLEDKNDLVRMENKG